MELVILTLLLGMVYYLRFSLDHPQRGARDLARMHSGIQIFENGDVRDAFLYFDNQIKHSPNSAAAYLYRGLCYERLGELSFARHDFMTGIAFDIRFEALYVALAKVQVQQHDLVGALHSLSEAIRLSGRSNPEYYRQRAHLHLRLGDLDQAATDSETEHAIKTAHQQHKRSGCATKRAGLGLLTEVLIGLVSTVILLLTIMESATVQTPYLVAILLAVAYGVPCKPSKVGAILLTLTWSAMIYVTMISRISDEWIKIELLGLVVATTGMLATVYLTSLLRAQLLRGWCISRPASL